MKVEALRRLGASLRIGGPGTARRKFKVVRKRAGKAEDVKFQNTLKRLGINPLAEIEELTMFKDNGATLRFTNPRVLASVSSNTFVVQGGFTETKPVGAAAPDATSVPAVAATSHQGDSQTGGGDMGDGCDDEGEVAANPEEVLEAALGEAEDVGGDVDGKVGTS